MVLIDNHLNLDSTATDNADTWVYYYGQLMRGIVGMGAKYQNAVMVDILNEPDSRGISCVTPLFPFILVPVGVPCNLPWLFAVICGFPLYRIK